MAQDEKMLAVLSQIANWTDDDWEMVFAHRPDLVERFCKAALSAAPAQPAAVEGAEWLTDEDRAVIKRCVERQPKLCMRGQHEGYYVHSDIADLINMIGRARPSPPADDALRVAAIVAKNMADNASFNLNQAGLTIETAACDRAFVDIYRTLDAALKAGGVK